MTGAPVSCREVVDFLASYLEGELPPDVHADFQRHLGRCAGCVQYLESYREAIRLGRRAFDPDGPVPPEVPEELVQAILASKGSA